MSINVKAVAKAVRIAPRKVGEVASLVKGRTVEDALVILEHTPRRSANAVAKVISSAAANAENNHKLDPKTLVIETISVGNGFALKRFRPAAHGRALPYKKMTSNITVIVSGSEKRVTPKKAAAKKAEAGKKTETTKTAEKSSSAKKEEK